MVKWKDRIAQKLEAHLSRATQERLEAGQQGPDPLEPLERIEKKFTGFVERHPRLQRLVDRMYGGGDEKGR